MTHEFSVPWFSLRNITYTISADPLLLKSPVLRERKQFLASVLVFEQKTKQRQLNA